MTQTKKNRHNPVSKTESNGESAAFIARHEWTMVGLIAALAFILGCIGFARTLPFTAAGGEYTWWDIFYSSLRLFILEGSDATAGWPIYLQIARVLAPLVVIYTATKAVWNYARQEISLYLILRRKRGFVVICGVGETGYRIARDYCLNSKMQVVIIDRDPLNALATSLQRDGAIFICGNAMDPLTLAKSRVVYARDLFLCTSDDKANVAIAKNTERLTRAISDSEITKMEAIAKSQGISTAGDPTHPGLRCFLCVDDPDIYEVFAAHSFFDTNTPCFSLRLFNRRETIARNVFRLCAPDMYYRPSAATDAGAHVLVIGFEALAREIILQTALTAHYTDFRLPQITVLCGAEYREQVIRFQHRYPHLDKTLDTHFHYGDSLTISEQQWLQMQPGDTFTTAYVAMDNDVEAILTARRLNRLRHNGGHKPLSFVVCLNQQNFLAEIIDDDFPPITLDKNKLPDYEPIEYFETLDKTISIDIVVNESLDNMARTLHESYLHSLSSQGQSATENPSLLAWSDLPAHKKKANQHAAAHIEVKLRCCNCQACKGDIAQPQTPFPPNDKTLELLAQLEHRRWMADKYIAGYSFGKVRDDDRMWHPDLIPWEELSEQDKEKDRDNVRMIPALLSAQNLKVCLN